MSTITLRNTKGSALTFTEMDDNFTNLNTDKLQNVSEDTTPQLGGSLDVNGQKIVSVSNGNIDIEPNGTGNVLLGNFTFDADQTVGAGQDNYVLTYDNSSGTISLEAAASGGLNNVSEDTTPQLGGNLDVNGNSIVSASAGNIAITPDTTGSIVLDGVNWPQADGSASQFLQTNGAGQLSYASITEATGNELENVSEDTTPQLGGNLDVNGNSIVSVSNGNIAITPNGTGQVQATNLRYDEDIHALTYAATITPDVANGNVQTITLTGNLTFNAFSNPVAGQSLTLIIDTNGTGRTLTTTMKTPAGTDPTMSTTDTTDICTVFYDGTNYFMNYVANFAQEIDMPLGFARSIIAKIAEAVDTARSAVTVTVNGNTKVSTTHSKFGGTAAQFDGTGDYLTAPCMADLTGSTAMTWECFFLANYDTGSGTVAVLSNRTGGTSNGEVQMLFRNFDNKVQVNAYGTGAWNANGVGSALTPANSGGSHNHFALGRDASGNYAVWVNGTRVANGTGWTQDLSVGGDGNLGIGAHADGTLEFNDGGATGDDVGWIDEVRVSVVDRYGVSNTSITVPTVAFANDDDTRLLLHMNGQNNDTTFEDDTGSRTPVNVDTVFGGELDTAQKQFGTASWYNDAEYDGVKISDESPFDGITSSTAFTLEMWVRRQANPTANECFLFDNSQCGLYYDETANRLKYETEGIDRITSSGSLNTNTWYHVAVVRDTSNNVKLYIDGTQSGSTYTNDDRAWSNAVEHLIGVSTSGTKTWVGHIDEFRISTTQRYTTTFTPSTSAFTNDDDTICLFHFDGTDATTTIEDDNA